MPLYICAVRLSILLPIALLIRSINDLNLVFGMEVAATPQIQWIQEFLFCESYKFVFGAPSTIILPIARRQFSGASNGAS
ncbi:MAG: hypothetical protein FWG10_06205 [Eubacteriaceae bacterium]|nr:hypothetical protein [Eubacteriaceae bacterium]